MRQGRCSSWLVFRFVAAVAIAMLTGGSLVGQAAIPAEPLRTSLPGQASVLDINSATPAELAALPGMGPAYARRVVEGRPYSAKNQLVTRGVLPQAAYEAIRDRVVAHRPPKT